MIRAWKSTSILTWFFLLFLAGSCSVNTEETERPDGMNTSLNTDREEIDKIGGRVPKPGVITQRLEETGTDFDWSFLQIRDYPRPENDTSQAILSGILTADVGYFISFDQSDFENPYYERLNLLSGEMCRIPRDDLDELNRAFEERGDRRDSLIQLLNTIYDRTTQSLQRGNKGNLAILYTTSDVAEKMFITASLIDNYPKDLLAEDSRAIIIIPLVRTLLEQEPHLEDAILLLEQGKPNGFSTRLKRALQDLDQRFDMLNIDEDLRQRRADLLMADTTFQGLREQIKHVRSMLLEKAG